MFELKTIGIVESDFEEPADPDEMRQHISKIKIKPEFEEGLYKIEDNKKLQVIFNFHLAEGYNLKSPRRHGKIRGVFNSRSPKRPSSIGVTTVELLKKEGRELTVKGLDAVSGTPVLDIKPYAPAMDEGMTSNT